MKSIVLLLALATPMVALAAPSEPADQVDAATLVVVVFDARTGRPVPSRTVRAHGEVIGATDAYGRLVVGMLPGDVVLSVEQSDGQMLPIQPVRLRGGVWTEALVTVFDDGRPPEALVEQPDADRANSTSVDAVLGSISGRILSSEDGAPIGGVRIYVRGNAANATSQADGTFTLELPVGEHDLSLIHDRYATHAISDVQVGEEGNEELKVEMVPAGLQLEDFTIRAPRIEGGTNALLEDRRTASGVGDMLGSEQITRNGDSTAGGALRRVTGLTLVDGRYIYVRGLGERYSSTLLNGANLPSPEPDRRVVPMDMFPAGILQSVVVQKSYQPDMPGEFGGGSVQLQTKNLPEEPIFKLGLSGGWNSISTFKKGLGYTGGKWDWLGVGARSRRLPSDVLEASKTSRIAETDQFCVENCYNAERLEELGEQFESTWDTKERRIPINSGLSLTAGSPFTLFGKKAGVLFAGAYSNSQSHNEYKQTWYNLGADNELEVYNEYDFIQSSARTDVSGILTAGVQVADGHEIKSTSLVLRATTDEARQFSGLQDDAGAEIRVTRLRYLEQMLLVQQLTGDHQFGEGGPHWGWRYSLARASRIEPDRKEYRYDYEEGSDTWQMTQLSDGNLRFFSDLVDVVHDIGTDLDIPVGPEVGEDKLRPTIRLGSIFQTKARTVDSRRFGYRQDGEVGQNPELNALTPNQIFTPDVIGDGGYQFGESTRETDNYTAVQNQIAVYGMADVPVTSWLRVMAGTRVEHNDQEVRTFALFDDSGEPIVSRINKTDVLPGAMVTWSPGTKTNMRLGWGRTVSRPDFREMSPATFSDVTGGRSVKGNDQLTRARIDNFDARLEHYPNPGETLSVAAFAKEFTDPIETVLIVSAERTQTWRNADSAWVRGVEFDARKQLDIVHYALKDFYLAGNLALIRSRVQLPEGSGTQTRNVRPLQGQSPYVVNVTGGWEHPEVSAFATIAYNVVGPRIIAAGSDGQPDTYEQPAHQLDLVVGVPLTETLSLSAKAKNLLNARKNVTQGGLDNLYQDRGRAVSASLSWKPRVGN